jgi:hypothetical protein
MTSDDRPDPGLVPPPDGPATPVRAKPIRRGLALALLGAALALAVVQVTRMIRHEAVVGVELGPGLLPGLRQVELRVMEEGAWDHPVSVVLFHFDSDHPPASALEHRFQLTNGRYELHISLRGQEGTQPLNARRALEVSGAVQTRFRLP